MKSRIATAIADTESEAVELDVDPRIAEALRRATAGLAVPRGDAGLLDTILVRLLQLVRADGASVLLQQGSRLRVAATRGRVPAQAQRGREYQVVEQPLYREMQRLGRPVAAPEVVPERGLPSSQSGEMMSSLLVPLAVEGRIVGALKLSGDHQFMKSEATLLQVFAEYAALAIENARLSHRVDAAQTRTRALALAAVSAHERDRELLSRELHDDAGQALTALKIQLELLQRDYPQNPAMIGERLGEAVELADQTLDHIRILSHDLRPPTLSEDRIGDALRSLCREFSKRTRLPIDYAGAEAPALPDGAGICLFRVLQESLTNVAKHAAASRVRVRLRYDDRGMRMSIEDNGCGFDVGAILGDEGSSTGIGLRSMRDRMECLGGELEIHSEPDWGTRLIAEIPLSPAN